MSNVKSQMSNLEKKQVKQDYEKRIYSYALRLVKFLRLLPNDTVAREIVRQLIRSGTSISANYIEARSASSRKDFINFLTHSLKSANETEFWLDILFDSNLIAEKLLLEATWLKNETKELAKIIAASIITLKSKDK